MGNIYDKVLEVGDVPRFPHTGTCIFPIDWLYEILRLTYDAKNIYANFSERLQAVVRSSHAAIGYGEDVFLEKISHLSNALPIFKSGLPRIERQDIKKDLRGFLANIETVQLLRSKRADPSQLMRDLMRISPRRPPFVTEKGHLGLSSQYIKPGDLVAVVGGAQVPFILRKRNSEKYEIIGEAYVDGIMNGEAVKDCKWEYVELV
ncbi:hypothetical protein BS50DRAFT_510017 [Corynespora cassiicola Philippines]|uniref:Heterokaryon incompatibility domain-containing protein n=1 Tax=Corynespora cassiicola Philippines TaxID=1448308 RepID=A0A2T2MZL4_CORCC|nr:hypothetical protein BS50DRAFT_510017 [Corynespora cassiicola Philippines]